MANVPEVSGSKRYENECPQLVGNAPQKSCLTSTTPGNQHPAQVNESAMNLIIPSMAALTLDSPGECSSSTYVGILDIDHLIGSCDLKSEEITSLMAEELPSSESNYGSCSSLIADTRDIQAVTMEDATPSTSEISEESKLDSDIMPDWSAEVSDDSDMHSCREPLIPHDNESDIEELVDIKENVESTTFDNDRKDSFVNDLINLNESQEKIPEAVPNPTVEANVSLMDIAVESPSNETALADETLVDIEVEPATNQADATHECLMDIVIEPVPVQADGSLDNKIEESMAGENQDSIKGIENFARAHSELIRDVMSLNTFFRKTNKIEIAASTQKGLHSLDEELRAEAEANLEKKKAARTIAEIGFPKVKISDEEKIARDEDFTKYRRKNLVGTSTVEVSVNSDLKKEKDDLSQSTETDEVLKQPTHGTDSEEYINIDSITDSTNLNKMEENSLDDKNAAQIETRDSTEIDTTSKSIKVEEALNKPLKKRVTFADKKVEPGMEHMAAPENEFPKPLETPVDNETSLRFLTESYPSHEDDEMLSESLNATLEASTFPRHRRGSPRVRGRVEAPQKLFEELKTLEGDEQLDTLSVSPCKSPQLSELADSTTKNNKTPTNTPNGKVSKFFKSMKKKIFS